jgi:transaldolase
MKLFLDSADPREIRASIEQGGIQGVSLGGSPGALDQRPLIKEICAIFKGPVNADGLGADLAGMLDKARALARIAPQVVVTLPFTPKRLREELDDGLEVVRSCAAEGIKTNVTGCLSPAQAIRAAGAGAAYVSLLGDRLEDIEGLDLVRKIVAVYKTYGIETEVLVASVRSTNDIVEAALAGAQIATVPFHLLRQIIEPRR